VKPLSRRNMLRCPHCSGWLVHLYRKGWHCFRCGKVRSS
jgi:ribosomal protein S27AE